MVDMSINLFLNRDEFYLMPRTFTTRLDGDNAMFFGYAWSFSVHWLWFELVVCGNPHT